MHFALDLTPFATPPICSIIGRPCVRTFETKECLIHALMYLNGVLGIELGMFTTWNVMAHNNQ